MRDADGVARDGRGVSRRTFIGGACALAGAAVLGVAVAPQTAAADLLRPPGSLPEADFAARCIRCERCISVCPTDVLAPAGIEQGVLAVRTPFVDFASDACTFCDLCRQVCPTAAIGAVDPYAPQDGRIGVAVVHPDRCLAFLQSGSCGVCVDACPYEALDFDDERRPVVDEAKCNGCGECVKICPANVLTSFSGGSVRGIEVVTDRRRAEMEVTA